MNLVRAAGKDRRDAQNCDPVGLYGFSDETEFSDLDLEMGSPKREFSRQTE